jgi:hypothetical protein
MRRTVKPAGKPLTNKQLRSKSAASAMGLIAQGLLQDYLAPGVFDLGRFRIALVQALYDAYAQGWKDCQGVDTKQNSHPARRGR